MLRLETVEPRTFSLLKQLMEIPELQEFSLVGDTALSLLYGHRKSVDLDLFSQTSFDNTVVISVLEKKFKSAFVNRTTNPRFGIFYFVDADESEDPISLKEQTWLAVQKFIKAKVREYLRKDQFFSILATFLYAYKNKQPIE